MTIKPPLLAEKKKRILIFLSLFVSFGFSLLSSFYVQSIGCGILSELVDCGFYAGFPVPFAQYNSKSIKNNQIDRLLNPSFYYKYKFSPLSQNRSMAISLLKKGEIFPFYLQNEGVYLLNKGLLLINSILWIAPVAFLFIIFF